MNAPFKPTRLGLRLASVSDPDELRRIETYVAAHPDGTAFHRPAWLLGAAAGTGNRALALLAERGGEIAGYVPLVEVHSPLFGRVLASSGFGVGGGMLINDVRDAAAIFAALEELALRRNCPSIELRGGVLPGQRKGWTIKQESHCGFVRPLASDDEAELLQIPRKQRAEVRKGLANDLQVTVGSAESDRSAHYAVYAESVRNLGTPVFPRALFDGVMDRFGNDADVLTVWHQGKPVSSVLSLYHKGDVMPYWGGGTWDARRLRANDRMYYELMLHARRRGCARFDFGRSKTHSGPYDFKRNWGFEPEPLAYAQWTAPDAPVRDADPTSAKHAMLIAAWKRLPLPLANLLGPHIARGLG
ncbi:FemAB family XrtA/PEP-CTERM system-associated protein [Novosphingobium sp.]|uniref:FemAB family XrtA/PEP-CTERM system-associated protein n=1 Tax=Novosphingobium sp. TaxID=1874826 RepID=UPI0025DA4286|nr:FemAB family XrtA/PEP-CTERM system-associated protein [Novosphingobium sp.]MCC6924269.1 FemAB family PEP-CTERM system-associated protein [Novosphingobium sp.]